VHRQHRRRFERRRRSPRLTPLLEHAIDRHPLGGRELLLGLPGELRKILENRTHSDRIEWPWSSDERKTARKVVSYAAKPDVSGPHLKVG
jgi:hypothetical protein